MSSRFIAQAHNVGLLLLLVAEASAAAAATSSAATTTNQSCADNNESSAHTGIAVVQINAAAEAPLILTLFVVVACVAKLLFHLSERLTAVVPESILLIALGLLLGGILFQTRLYERFAFTADVFFLFLLPPIVLEAGYFIKTSAFFGNIGTILLYAIVGTLWNTFALGASLYGVCAWGWVPGMEELALVEALFFASLTSAVDPVAVLAVFEEIHVNEVLHILVLGESILNDAISIVLYRVFQALVDKPSVTGTDVGLGVASFFTVSFGALAIGIVAGILTAIMTRFSRHVSAIQPILVLGMGYLAYVIADFLHWSGIVSAMFCAISLRRYAEQNIDEQSRTAVKFVLKNLGLISEAIIFIFLGLHTVSGGTHEWNGAFVGFTLLFIVVYRFIGIFALSALANAFEHRRRIGWVDQFAIAYGGLRGAVSFSLIIIISDCFWFKKIFFTTTVAVVLFTVVVLGLTIKPVVKRLHVSLSDSKEPTVAAQVNDRILSHTVAGLEDIAGTHGWYWAKEWFAYVSATYVGPLLLRDNEFADQEIVRVFISEQYREVGRKCDLSRCKPFRTSPSDKSVGEDVESGGNDCCRRRRRERRLQRQDSGIDRLERDEVREILHSPLVPVHEFFRTGAARNKPTLGAREMESKLKEMRRRRKRKIRSTETIDRLVAGGLTFLMGTGGEQLGSAATTSKERRRMINESTV